MAESTYKPLTSIGITVAVDDILVANAKEIGDFGGEPNTLDATPLSSDVKVNKLGVQEQDKWNLKYFFQNDSTTSDFRVLNAYNSDRNKLHTIKVTFSDGTVFSNEGTISNYATGAGNNQMLEAVASFALSGKWRVTNPTT